MAPISPVVQLYLSESVYPLGALSVVRKAPGPAPFLGIQSLAKIPRSLADLIALHLVRRHRLQSVGPAESFPVCFL